MIVAKGALKEGVNKNISNGMVFGSEKMSSPLKFDGELAMKNRKSSDNAANGVRLIKCTSRDNPLPPMAYLKTSGGIFHAI